MKEPTQQQIRKIFAVQRDVFGDVDKEVIKNMSFEEASEYIDKLEAKRQEMQRPAVQKTVSITSSEPVQTNIAKNASLEIKTFNPIQMGMVKKAVADFHLGNGKWIPSAEAFADQCAELYEAFEWADEVVKRKYPEARRCAISERG